MLLKNILNEVLAETESQSQSGPSDADVIDRTLKDTFKLSNTGLNYVKAELEKMNKRAKRNGLEPITLKIVREFDENIRVRGMDEPVKAHFYEVSVEGKAPIIDGYEFIAGVEHAEGGNIINMAPKSSIPALPIEYQSTGNTCDHCHTKRDRLSTFVLRDEKSGKLLKVGRSCLKNFLPGKNPKSIVEYAQQLENILRSCVSGENMDDYDESDISSGRGGSWSRYYPADMFMQYVCLAYTIEGRFISAKVAREDPDKQSTSSYAWWLHNFTPRTREEEQVQRDIDQKRPAAEALYRDLKQWLETKDWDAEIEKYQETNPSLAQYFHNLKTLANASSIARKNSSYQASILAIYLREKGEKEKKAVQKPSNFVGEVGKKIQFVGTIKNTKWFDGQFGTTTLVSFQDDDGNDYVWWASGTHEYEKGDRYNVSATVKKHETSKYTSRPQTVITRAKMTKV